MHTIQTIFTIPSGSIRPVWKRSSILYARIIRTPDIYGLLDSENVMYRDPNHIIHCFAYIYIYIYIYITTINVCWFTCSLVHWFYWFNGLLVHWFTGSTGSLVLLVLQVLLVHWFTGSLVLLVRWFYWFNGSMVH